jgi:hypothetical protein
MRHYGITALGCVTSLALSAVLAASAGAQTGTTAMNAVWSGEMIDPEGQVVATIQFELRHFKSDTVHGAIRVIETGQTEPIEIDQFASRTERQTHYREMYVHFVDVVGGGVLGFLTPYRDSGCGCAMTTTLSGTIAGDRISGSYKAHHRGSGLDETGTWWVVRRE